MEIFEKLTGRDGLIILGLIVMIVFLYNKYKNYRYIKDMEKRRKNKDN
ncbi:hypothetical protein SCB49_05537 [unidentified eubacterium SCB49]|nr:hypothetical protein SCB49_05537 [unidentified eubacterium SCB49]